MMLQLTLPIHDVIALQTGGRTHILVRALPGDVYEPLSDAAGRVVDATGQTRFMTDNTVRLCSTEPNHIVETVLTQIQPQILNVIELSSSDAPLFGGTLLDIWESWTAQHDKNGYGWWVGSRDLFLFSSRERGFRKFLRTRDPARYMAWSLGVSPIHTAESAAALTALLQSVR